MKPAGEGPPAGMSEVYNDRLSGVDTNPRAMRTVAVGDPTQATLGHVISFRAAHGDGANQSRAASRAHNFFRQHDPCAVAGVEDLAVEQAAATSAIAMATSAVIAVI